MRRRGETCFGQCCPLLRGTWGRMQEPPWEAGRHRSDHGASQAMERSVGIFLSTTENDMG